VTTPELKSENRHLGDLGSKLLVFAAVPGAFLVGLALVMTAKSDITWERFLRGYTAAFTFVLSICLGALFFTILQHLARAGWSVVVRRIAEALASNLRWIWILFIPIAIGLFKTDLYEWTHAEGDDLLEHKAGYLNTTFWMIRVVFYFAVWAGLAHFFVRNSIAQDDSGDPKLTIRMGKVAAPAMILYAITQTFAVIDWVMAIEPKWFSTMFGVYFFAASCCGFFATLVLLCYGLQRSGRVTESITPEHYQDLGKHLFAFGIVFWAYIAYSQYMLIWYGNIQEETTWFLIRQLGGWQGLTILLLVGHFLGPFLIIMSRYPKRWKSFLAAVCVWMLFIHYIDMYWLVVPAYPHALVESVTSYGELIAEFESGVIPGTNQSWQAQYGLHWHIVDGACLLGLAGIVLGLTSFGVRSASLIPVRDPRLPESLAFENF
jgi:hypothetical protein